MCESKQLNEIAELLMSARADIVVNLNFVAAVEALNIALDEIAAISKQQKKRNLATDFTDLHRFKN